MSIYRFTMFIGQANIGASEVYYTNDIASPSQACSQIQALLNIRASMLPGIVNFNGVRIAQDLGTGQAPNFKRVSQVFLPGKDPFFGDQTVLLQVPDRGTFPNSSAFNLPDLFRNCLEVRQFFAGGRKATRYPTSLPASMVGTDPNTFIPNGNAQWYVLLQDYQNELASGRWQVLGVDTTSPIYEFSVGQLVLSQGAPVMVGIQLVPLGGVVNIPPGTFIHIYGYRPAKYTRGPTINGRWQVAYTDITNMPTYFTAYLLNSSKVDPTTQRATPNTIVRIVAQRYYPITGAAYQRVAWHKRGKHALAPVGRRLFRPTLDP